MTKPHCDIFGIFYEFKIIDKTEKWIGNVEKDLDDASMVSLGFFPPMQSSYAIGQDLIMHPNKPCAQEH